MSNVQLIEKLPDSIYAVEQGSNNRKLWNMFAVRLDELDKVFGDIQLLTDPVINSGVQLDLLGKILRCFRKGQSDLKYLKYLLVSMRKYQSSGSISDLNEILNALLGDDFLYIKDMNESDIYEAKFLDGSSYLDGSFFLTGDITRPRLFTVVVSDSLDADTLLLVRDVANSCKGGGIQFKIKTEVKK